MSELEFYFDYRSPYAYLAQRQVRGFGVEVDWRPFDIRNLMQQVGNTPTSVTCKAKNRYVSADLQRWVRFYGAPYQRHPQMGQLDVRRLLRATVLADEAGRASQAVEALFHALWGSPAPLESAQDVAAILDGAGVTGSDVVARLDDPALDGALAAKTSAAAERGVFGAPTMFVGDEMFFGNDRLDFVRASLGLAR